MQITELYANGELWNEARGLGGHSVVLITQSQTTFGTHNRLLANDIQVSFLRNMRYSIIEMWVKRSAASQAACLSKQQFSCMVFCDPIQVGLYLTYESLQYLCSLLSANLIYLEHLIELYTEAEYTYMTLFFSVAAVSRCYRAETSTIEEESGIFRVHQFIKVLRALYPFDSSAIACHYMKSQGTISFPRGSYSVCSLCIFRKSRQFCDAESQAFARRNSF